MEIPMRRLYAVCCFVLLIAVISPCAKAQTDPLALKPGLWELTVEMKSPIAAPPVTSEFCIAKEHGKPDRPQTKSKDDCQVLDQPAPGNEAAYTVTCAKLKRTLKANFKYYGDHYEGTTTTTWNDVEIVHTYTARLIGECESASSGPKGSEK
jgi:hypothetical protein